jgi:hypothetical protein
MACLKLFRKDVFRANSSLTTSRISSTKSVSLAEEIVFEGVESFVEIVFEGIESFVKIFI